MAMSKQHLVPERSLAALAKRFRVQAGKTRAQAAREMKVAQSSIFQAEEVPKLGLVKLRVRMIESYSPYKTIGPLFLLRKSGIQS